MIRSPAIHVGVVAALIVLGWLGLYMAHATGSWKSWLALVGFVLFSWWLVNRPRKPRTPAP